MLNEEIKKLIQLYVDEKLILLGRFPVGEVSEVVEDVWQVYEWGNTIFACGNGGNAAFVSNFITDITNHPFVGDDKKQKLPEHIKRFKGVDLSSSSAEITGIMNDLGSKYIFSQQLINHGIRKGDIVFGFTGSGNSENILEAFRVAKERGAKTVVISRGSGGKARHVADRCIIIPGTSNFPGQVGGNDNNFHYEDATSAIAHMITGIMRQRVWDAYGTKSESG